jgi:hypothetical protein
MRNRVENNVETSQNLLRNQKGEGDVVGWLVVAAVMGALLYSPGPGFQKGARTTMNEPDFPGGAKDEFSKTAAKFSIVYEGQQQPGCVGDIEKVAPIINKAGEIRGLSVLCKPNPAEPAK